MKNIPAGLLLFSVLSSIGLAGDGASTPVSVSVPSSAVEIAEPAKQNLPADFYAQSAAGQIRLDSDAGRALLSRESPDYLPLRANWVPQLKSHCGACSSVVVMNSLLPGAGFTQNSIFNPATAHIISQDTVYKMGFTLQELTMMIRMTSALRAEPFHAGPDSAEGEHGYEDWIFALKANRGNARDRLICNFSTGWLRERKNNGGHFSPVADYNEKENKVLILEVSGSRPSFWVDTREMWDAMSQVDKVSGRVRGWIVVSRPE